MMCRNSQAGVSVGAAVGCLVALAAGCGDGSSGARSDVGRGGGVTGDEDSTSRLVWFEDRAEDAGIVARWTSGHREGRVLFPEIMGGGTALFDADNDGDLDAYVLEGGALDGTATPGVVNRLFLNAGDGTFEDATSRSGAAADGGYAMGVAAGDFDTDGLNDLYITNIGVNTLLRNAGGGRFEDVTGSAGVGHDGWGTSATFVDYDADGDLDLFFSNYIFWSADDEIACYSDSGAPDYCSPNSYSAPAPDVLYRNNGDGTFTDVSSEAGLTGAFGNGLGVVTLDYNGDHLIDVFVANDQTRNQLWKNNGDGTFTDVAFDTGTALDQHGKAKAGMGTHAVDVDGDADEDLLVVNLRAQSDSFYRNVQGYFLDDTGMIGLGVVSRPYTRFGVGFVDFDNDGTLDLYQANGAVVRPTGSFDESNIYSEENMLIVGGRGDGGAVTFAGAEGIGGTAKPIVRTSRGAAFGDIDNDGRVDILIGNMDANVTLLRNVADDAGSFVMFRVENEHGRDDLGALVRLDVEGNGTLTRRVRSGYSYQSTNDPRVHIGLGDAGSVGRVRVRWVDGTSEMFGGFPAGTIATLRKGEGAPVDWE